MHVYIFIFECEFYLIHISLRVTSTKPFWFKRDKVSPVQHETLVGRHKVTDKSSAAQYYLSKSRYSPSAGTIQRKQSGRTQQSAQPRPPFGSTVPRFGYLGNPESAALKHQSSVNLLPSRVRPDPPTHSVVDTGSNLSSKAGSWRPSGVYHPSISATTRKTNLPGRTDWSAK